jgi:hypothetical protein
MEDAIFDAEYQDYLHQRQVQTLQMWDEYMKIEDEAYEIMAEQHFKDLELLTI